MSPNRGRHLIRQAKSNADRSGQGRPSLFAGMEEGDSIVPDDDAPRGGILSTLESVRQKRAGNRGGRAQAGRGPWQGRALIGLMAAGVVALMSAFVLVVRNGHPQAGGSDGDVEREMLAHIQKNQQAEAAASEVRDLTVLSPASADATPAAALPSVQPAPNAAPPTLQVGSLDQEPESVSPADAAPPAPPAARIEDVRPASAAPAAKLAAASVAPAPAPKATRQVTALAPVAAASAPAKTSDKTRQARRHTDDDVALIEAMFNHGAKTSGPPAAGPSVGDQLRTQCGGLAGAAAATCRARICVSNPGAAACHDAAP